MNIKEQALALYATLDTNQRYREVDQKRIERFLREAFSAGVESIMRGQTFAPSEKQRMSQLLDRCLHVLDWINKNESIQEAMPCSLEDLQEQVRVILARKPKALTKKRKGRKV